MKNSVNDIVTNGLCIGCGLCESLAGKGQLEMVMTAEGRDRPQLHHILPDQVTDSIFAVCPGTQIHGMPDSEIAPGTEIDPIWGPIIQIDRGYAADPDIRFRGSTGGVLTALGIYLLESKKVDYIAHIAADPNRPMRSEPHLSFTKDDVLKAAGSRYGPAAPLKNFLSLLDRGQPFAFIGKPCDISAVRNLAKLDQRVDQLCLYLLTLVCGGASDLTKSQFVLQDFELDEDELALFRYRGFGNPGKTRIETKDGRAFELTYNDLWEDEGKWQIQYRCKICADAIGESADIAASDVWPGGGPTGEDAGFNGVLARTQRGADLVQAAVADGYLILDRPITAREMDEFQPHQVRKKRAVWMRLKALKQAGKGVPQTSGLRLQELSAGNEPSLNASELEGATRRINAGQFSEPPH